MDIKDIDKNWKYKGYIWKSDKEEPQTLNDETIGDAFDDISNPFVIEALLYSEEHKTSYTVRYVNGKYIVSKFDTQKQENDSEVKFFSKRIKNNPTLHFIQRWKECEEPENLCEGMNTLVPAELVFIGFNK